MAGQAAILRQQGVRRAGVAVTHHQFVDERSAGECTDEVDACTKAFSFTLRLASSSRCVASTLHVMYDSKSLQLVLRPAIAARWKTLSTPSSTAARSAHRRSSS